MIYPSNIKMVLKWFIKAESKECQSGIKETIVVLI
jgi:hypothetical protein